jgi:hypothetical protein
VKFFWNNLGKRLLEDKNWISVISVFRCEVDGKCAFPVCYAASSGNSLQTFRVKLSVPSSGEDGKCR